MGKTRMEAFSDGVIAIIITIMVLELRPPHGVNLTDLQPLVPSFLAYVLSFAYLGIYWNNHHHMMHLVKTVNGPILWANLHLLFWLSLTPFGTAWLADSYHDAAPVATYAFLLMMNGVAYAILVAALIRHEGPDSQIATAFGRDYKGKISVAFYLAAIVMAFFMPAAAIALCAIVALIWFIPDRRVERALGVS
jgi:uncharacterized membrane protein